MLGGEDAAALVLDVAHLEARLAHAHDGLLDGGALLLVDVRLALARALADLKVVGDLLVAAHHQRAVQRAAVERTATRSHAFLPLAAVDTRRSLCRLGFAFIGVVFDVESFYVR